MGKPIVNIVYPHWHPTDAVRYETDDYMVTMSRHRRRDAAHNVGMNSFSQKLLYPGDSILLLEPHCILPDNYDDRILRWHKVFTWSPTAFPGRGNVVVINHPVLDFPLPPIDSYKRLWLPWNDRRHEITMVNSNKNSNSPDQLYSLRVELLDFFATRMPTTGYARDPFSDKSWYRGTLGDKYQHFCQVKFALCTENCYHDRWSSGYLTEKLPQVLTSGTVPLYVGCYNIDELNLPKSYIDLRPYLVHSGGRYRIADYTGLFREIENYTEDRYNHFVQEIDDSINHPEGLYYQTSTERALGTIAVSLLGG